MKFSLLKDFARQGPLTIRINGTCMHEAVSSGSNVRLAANRFYWPGDILAFKRGGDEIVSHRFLGYVPGRRGWVLITRADTAKRADGPIRPADVLGRVTHVDGVPYRPGMVNRLCAQAACYVSFARLVVSALREPAIAQKKE